VLILYPLLLVDIHLLSLCQFPLRVRSLLVVNFHLLTSCIDSKSKIQRVIHELSKLASTNRIMQRRFSTQNFVQIMVPSCLKSQRNNLKSLTDWLDVKSYARSIHRANASGVTVHALFLSVPILHPQNDNVTNQSISVSCCIFSSATLSCRA